MKIKDIYIAQYGLYQDKHIDETHFTEPVTLFFGPNEAGKSTLHSFIRSMLFGFQLKSSTAYSPAVDEKPKGALTLLNETGDKIRLERQTPPKKGKVTLHMEDGRMAGEQELRFMLKNVSAPVFQHIFAFGHQELQHLHTLQSEDVSAYLYSAAMGTGNVHLLETEKKMQRAQDELFKPKAVNPHINQQLKKIESLEQDVQQLHNKLTQYGPLQEEWKAQKQKLGELKRTRSNLDQDRRRTELVQNDVRFMQDKKNEIKQFDEEIDSLKQNIAGNLERLGPSWTLDKMNDLDLSLQAQDVFLHIGQKKQEAHDVLKRNHDIRKDAQQREQQLTTEMEHQQRHLKTNEQALNEQTQNLNNRQMFPQNRQTNITGKMLLSIGVAILLSLTFFALEQVAGGVILLLASAYLLYVHWNKNKESQAQHAFLSIQLEQERLKNKADLERQLEVIRIELSEKRDQLDVITQEYEQAQQVYATLTADWNERLTEMGIHHEISVQGLSKILHVLTEVKQDMGRTQRLMTQRETVRQQCTERKQRLVEHDAWLSDMNTNSDHEHETTIMEKCKEELIHIQEQDEAVIEQIEQGGARLGQIEAELQGFVTEQQFSLKQQELEEKKQQMHMLAKEWGVNRIAQHICTSIRRVYEEDRQPSVLKEAGRFLHLMTNGRYQQVIAPLGQQELVVVREHGERLSSKQLSRGTMEQLYLAMRFALIQEYGKHIRLPVVLDDPFINFDKQRLQKAMLGVKEIAETHQILIFTCHDHVYKQAHETLNVKECLL